MHLDLMGSTTICWNISPEDTLKILKEILNKIWISADFPHQWRAATVIPIPKPNIDHTDPVSYRPIALTSCLCKVLERTINARLIWYLEKYRIQAVGLFFDLEKAYETTRQYGIIRDPHRICLRGRLPVFVSEYLRDLRIRVRIGKQSLKNSTQRKVFQLVVSWLWHVLDWRFMSCPLVLPRTSSKHSLSMTWRSVFKDALWTPYRDIYSRQWMPYRNGRQEMASGLEPTSAKSYISRHHGLGLRDPHCEDWKYTFASGGVHKNSLGCGGTRTPHLRSTSVCWRHSARRLSTSFEWPLTWNGEGTETHSWCCTVPLFVPSLTMVALCMAQHQTPTYDNLTAFITLDWGWHWEHSAPAQCPACTQRPTKLLWRKVG